MLVLDRVTKRYPGGQVAVRELSLTIGEGETCVLVGPSGCGKTTLLRTINRMVEPTSGRILLNGEDVRAMDPVRLRLRMGYVIQQVGLFPHLTVAENVATVPRLLRWDRARIRARVAELLDLVGLEPVRFAHRYPGQLSGGQQQRVGVARALAGDPPVLLMDEPFGAIDRITRERLQDEFIDIQRRMRKTVVFVTHDIDEAVKMGDRIAILNEGALEQVDTPARLLANPATEFISRFLGPERATRRLAVVGIATARLDAVTSPAAPEVDAGASLADALTTMLLHDTDRVTVRRDGRLLGTLSVGRLLQAAAHPTAPAEDPWDRGRPGREP